MSLISIIVPVYNAEKYLSRCIESLIAQTLKDIEIILINDGSTDSSGSICDQYKKQDPRIQVIHQANTGQGIARNAGIKKASSPYIGFVDADDWVETRMFETMYNAAIREDADITMCNCFEIVGGVSHITQIKTTTNTLEHKQIIKEIILPMVGGVSLQDHYENNIPGYLWRCLYKSKLIKPISFISERKILFEDLWFNIQAMYQSSKIVIVPEQLYHYIHYQDSFVRTYKKDIWKRKQRLNDLISQFFEDNNIDESINQRIYTRQIIDLLESINNEVYGQNEKSVQEQKRAIIKMCLDNEMQEALRQGELGEISKFQQLRLKCIKKQHFNTVYYLSKGAYYYKKSKGS